MSSALGLGPIAPRYWPLSHLGPSDHEGRVTPVVRGRARRPYANRDQGSARVAELLRQRPAVCTGPVPPSLSQRTWAYDRSQAIWGVSASRCRRLLPTWLDASRLPPEISLTLWPEAVRPGPAIPCGRRPWPSVLRLRSGCGDIVCRQDCTADMQAAAFGSGVRAPVASSPGAVSGNGVEGLVTTSFT